MKHLFLTFITLITCVAAMADDVQRKYIDLSGEWLFTTIDSTVSLQNGLPRFTADSTVRLPGTTDTNQKGSPLTKTDETTHLSRRYSYVGKAGYQREITIPKDWRKHRICLYMERTKPTTVYVDGHKAGSLNAISTPQEYDLTRYLKPGRHTITIIVDNKEGVPLQLLTASHAFTEDTQTNWNGIIGNFHLCATGAAKIYNVQTFVDEQLSSLRIRAYINGLTDKTCRLKARLLPAGGDVAEACEGEVLVDKNNDPYAEILLPVSRIKDRWSEFSPVLNRLTLTLEGQDEVSLKVGLRTFCNHPADAGTTTNHFYINGQKTFLRGKHDACVFPLTAHVPMDKASWRKYFNVLKQYGINHVRFHSWCPPEECFAVADELGFYLQPELPFWGDFNEKDSVLMSYLHMEGLNILREYGHHPSFVMFALGNELWGSIDRMRSFVRDFRAVDPGKLYTLGSNYYLGYKESAPEMDYWTTCRIGGEAWGEYNTHTRGSFSFADAKDGGLINHSYPNTVMNLEGAIRQTKIPVISHETGQFQVYPDYNEIKKYTGVLRPCNMETFRKRLRRAGMLSQAAAFNHASGLWAVELYKADVELDLRTTNMAGFQLLDLQDYPGQGSAYVGLLDAFMESKNLVAPERWRGWCSAVVPLAELSRFCFTVGDSIDIGIKIADYSDHSRPVKSIKWQLLNDRNEVIEEGVKPNVNAGLSGLLSLGNITLKAKLRDKNVSERQRLVLSADGTEYRNEWNLWVYADCKRAVDESKLSSRVIVTDSVTPEIINSLKRGARVLLMPKATSYSQQTVGGLLQTDYWNYRMFKTICQNNKKPVSPGTLGLLVDTASVALKGFPTDVHTDWQWGVIAKNARPMVLDQLPEGYRPIVQVIDNVELNHRLGLLFELAVDKGVLLVCMSDLNSMKQYPEVRQFYKSIIDYLNGSDFNPKTRITAEQLNSLLTTKANDENIEELRNISFE